MVTVESVAHRFLSGFFSCQCGLGFATLGFFVSRQTLHDGSKRSLDDAWCSVHAYLNTPVCFVFEFTVPVVKKVPDSDC